MDLRIYYQKVREIESKIAEAFAVIVSLETPDGGKAGMLTEVSPGLAARMIVAGTAKLATAEEAQIFRQQQRPVEVPAGASSSPNGGAEARADEAQRKPAGRPAKS